MTTSLAIRLVLLAAVATSGVLMTPGCSSGPTTAPKSASDTKYTFWPMAPDEPRIQFLCAFNSSEDVAPTKSSGLEKIVFGAEAVKPAYVNKPYGVAIRDGKIYVCDIRAKALVVMDIAKKETRLVGITGSNRLERPVAVAISDSGEIFIADGVHSAIMVFDKQERFTRSIEISKLKPASLAIFGTRLYIVDMGRQQVLVYDTQTGKELGTIGQVGDEDGQFRLPIGVTTDKSGNVYVADMMRCKVQKFTPDGRFMQAVGEPGDRAGGFARPKHLTVDSEGILYVVDAAYQNVQMFNDEFKLLMHFGAAGDFEGSMNLPVGIASTDTGLDLFKDRLHPGFAAKRLIVVANQFGDNKISVYALGDRRSQYSLADLNASAAVVPSGVGAPSAEALKFQNIGGIEPGQNPAAPEAGKDAKPDAADPKSPEAKPATTPTPPKK